MTFKHFFLKMILSQKSLFLYFFGNLVLRHHCLRFFYDKDCFKNTQISNKKKHPPLNLAENGIKTATSQKWSSLQCLPRGMQFKFLFMSDISLIPSIYLFKLGIFTSMFLKLVWKAWHHEVENKMRWPKPKPFSIGNFN